MLNLILSEFYNLDRMLEYVLLLYQGLNHSSRRLRCHLVRVLLDRNSIVLLDVLENLRLVRSIHVEDVIDEYRRCRRRRLQNNDIWSKSEKKQLFSIC